MSSLVLVPFVCGSAALIALVIAAIGVLIYWRSSRRRAKAGMIVGGVLGGAGVLGVIAALVALSAWFELLRPREPTAVQAYQLALGFGFGPGPEVTRIQFEISPAPDSHQVLLRFHAPPETIATVVHGRFTRQNPDACLQRSRNVQGPPLPWWQPSPAPQAECYVAEPLDGLFEWNAAWLQYDRSTGYAHYHYLAMRHGPP
jgi:hypothetical protein